MAASAVNLPPGFELDQPIANSSPSVNLPPGFELDQPRQYGTRDMIGDVARPLLEGGGAAAGGLLASPLGPIAAAGGGALGFAAGKAGADLLDRGLGRKPLLKNVPQALGETANDAYQGAQAEGIGQVIGGAVNGVRSILNPIQNKLVPPFLKSTRGIPAQASKMALEDPSVLDLPGNSESIQGKSQNIINGLKDASQKVGGEFRDAYRQAGMNSPVDEIINGQTPAKPLFGTRSYKTPNTEMPGEVTTKKESVPGYSYRTPEAEIPGEYLQKTGNIPGYSYKGSPEFHRNGVDPSEVTGESPSHLFNVPGRSYKYIEQGPSRIIPGENVNVPGRSYTGLQMGEPTTILGKNVSFQDVKGTAPDISGEPSFEDLRQQYHSATSGDLFKNKDVVGSEMGMSDQEKLSQLTGLKRSLQNKTEYAPAGQQLSQSQGARNAAIKSMAADIDNVRGAVPGGESLAMADDAYHEMQTIREQLWRAFKDPATGQDYLNRILKGNMDWLTSGRNAAKVGAIQRVEQITGKQLLQPALKEMAAAYINNPDTMGLPSTGLKSILTSMIPTKSLFKRVPQASPMFGVQKVAPVVSGIAGDNFQNLNNSRISPDGGSNNYGNQQGDQNNQNSSMDGVVNQGKNLTREIAKKFLDLANGSKDLARELARKAGYSW